MAEEPMSAPGAPPPEPAPAPMGGWQAPPPVSMPGIPGFVYADVPNRFIALIIDGFVMLLGLIVIEIVLAAVGFKAGVLATGTDFVAGVIYASISLVIGGAYFIYTWTSMRASVGMKRPRDAGRQCLRRQDPDDEQADKRYLALWGPSTLSGRSPAISGIGTADRLIVFMYLVYLLYTTAKSPTKQGFHDIFANTVVVKAARTV